MKKIWNTVSKDLWIILLDKCRMVYMLLIGLLLTLYFSMSFASSKTDKASLSIRFKPVLIQEVAEDGYMEGNTVYSPTVRLTWGLRME